MKRPAQLGDHPRPVALTGDSTAGRFPRGQTAGQAVGLDALLPENRVADLEREPVRQATTTGRPFGSRLGAWAATFAAGTCTAPGTRPAFHSELSRTSSMVAPALSMSIASDGLTDGKVKRENRPMRRDCR